jgi:polyhydroxybutyrate depolymerase
MAILGRLANLPRVRFLAVAAIASLTVVACSTSGGSPVAPPSNAAASPSSLTPSATASAQSALVVGGNRPVTVHVPASYDPSRPAPLLIVLHGYTATGGETAAYFGIADPAEREGYVYAFPDGTIDSDGSRFWNATDACCNFDQRTVDDVAYLSGVIEDIQAALTIDPNRIVIAGHSNGGFMSYRMACERADLVSAIVSLAGATFVDPADCAPSEPVSVAQVHGTADSVVRFEGGGPFSDHTAPHPGARATAESWATYDGCRGTPTVLEDRLDIDQYLEDGSDPAETSVEAWTGCDAGSAVQLWTIPDGGHSPALAPSFGESVIRFLADHPKP